MIYDEGECVQCMHVGSYDEEHETIEKMHEFLEQNGFELDISESRLHHEIYLSDPRRVSIDKLKTVVRHPVKKNSKDIYRTKMVLFCCYRY